MGRVEVQLSNGATTINGGRNYVVVRSSNSTNWNAGNVFDDVDYLTLNLDSASNQTYDLTTNSFTNVARLDGLGSYLTLKINSAVAAGIASFYSNNDQIGQLVTSDASLDLSHTHVSGFKITSTNASGTTFLVNDIDTAFHVVGGPGNDTLVASGFDFAADQRNALFAASSIETIVNIDG